MIHAMNAGEKPLKNGAEKSQFTADSPTVA